MPYNARAWKRDANTVYMAANSSVSTVLIMKSEDKGHSFTTIAQHNFGDGYVTGFFGISGETEDILFITLYKYNASVSILKSVDSGLNWYKVYEVAGQFTSHPFTSYIYTSKGLLITHIALPGGLLRILTSSDLGERFTERINYNSGISSPIVPHFFGYLECAGDRILGPIVGSTSVSTVHRLYSLDGGLTWNVYNESYSTIGYSLGAKYLRLSDGYVVLVFGANILYPRTYLVYSANEGQSWASRDLTPSYLGAYNAISLGTTVIYQAHDNSLWSISDIISGVPTQVATSLPDRINDFIGF